MLCNVFRFLLFTASPPLPPPVAQQQQEAET